MGDQQGNSTASRDIAHYLHPYTNLKTHQEEGPLVITRGEGVHVFDEDGKAYLEGMSGLWCTALGFGEKRLIETATKAMEKLSFYHGFGGRVSDVSVDLAEKLISIAPVPMSKIFFANSGSEANDTVVKLVTYYNNAKGRRLKKKIISREKAYHGVTVASASLTGLPNNHRDFDLPIAGILHTDCPHYYRNALPGESEEEFATRLADNLDRLIREEGPDTVAAFIAEPVMGAGGVITPPATYFEKIQKVLKTHDVLFIADEVICGFGRTGNLWGSQTYDLKPDMLTTAKALSSAYVPISAVMINEDVFQALVTESEKIGIFGHGFTYSGHPVACAVALEAINIYQERNIVDHIQTVAGPLMQNGLKSFADHPFVGEVRGVGLVAAVEIVKDKQSKAAFDPKLGVGPKLVKFAQEEGLIIRALGDSVAFSPPLVINQAQVEEMLEKFSRALDQTTEWIREL
ncbi:MAG: aspartate aminotransferase family protein [Alphaproteobacteria bacterium]|nr:aspartate aminotransferase family protein [Rhodospirillales bacterium]MCW9044852.1 aspartate aminotransferase family protein [Alphaproteobacteria bacterium]